MADFLVVANSNILFIIIAVVLSVVALQALLFIRVAMKRCEELGMSKETVNKVITNSAIFSILPSLPIIITMVTLMPAIGMYIPWLRLSVIGSAMYESMAANTAIVSQGYAGLGDPTLSRSAFLTVVWVMTLGIMLGPLLNILFLKRYDSGMRGMMAKGGGFMTMFVPALFSGFMAVSITPMLVNTGVPVEMGVVFIAGISAVLLDMFGKKANIKVMSEFSFPLAMLIGMASAVLLTNIL